MMNSDTPQPGFWQALRESWQEIFGVWSATRPWGDVYLPTVNMWKELSVWTHHDIFLHFEPGLFVTRDWLTSRSYRTVRITVRNEGIRPFDAHLFRYCIEGYKPTRLQFLKNSYQPEMLIMPRQEQVLEAYLSLRSGTLSHPLMGNKQVRMWFDKMIVRNFVDDEVEAA